MCKYLENIDKPNEENENHPQGVPELLRWLSVRLLIVAPSQGRKFTPHTEAYIPAWSLPKTPESTTQSTLGEEEVRGLCSAAW